MYPPGTMNVQNASIQQQQQFFSREPRRLYGKIPHSESHLDLPIGYYMCSNESTLQNDELKHNSNLNCCFQMKNSRSAVDSHDVVEWLESIFNSKLTAVCSWAGIDPINLRKTYCTQIIKNYFTIPALLGHWAKALREYLALWLSRLKIAFASIQECLTSQIERLGNDHASSPTPKWHIFPIKVILET